MADMEMLTREWQIALRAPNGNILYAQELVDGGYDSDEPFDFFVTTEDWEYLTADVIDGTEYVSEDGPTIDWAGLIKYACEYDLDPDKSVFHDFCDDFDACEELDPEEIATFMMDAGVM